MEICALSTNVARFVVCILCILGINYFCFGNKKYFVLKIHNFHISGSGIGTVIWICYGFSVRLSNGLNEHVLHTPSRITPAKNTRGLALLGKSAIMYIPN